MCVYYSLFVLLDSFINIVKMLGVVREPFKCQIMRCTNGQLSHDSNQHIFTEADSVSDCITVNSDNTFIFKELSDYFTFRI